MQEWQRRLAERNRARRAARPAAPAPIRPASRGYMNLTPDDVAGLQARAGNASVSKLVQQMEELAAGNTARGIKPKAAPAAGAYDPAPEVAGPVGGAYDPAPGVVAPAAGAYDPAPGVVAPAAGAYDPAPGVAEAIRAPAGANPYASPVEEIAPVPAAALPVSAPAGNAYAKPAYRSVPEAAGHAYAKPAYRSVPDGPAPLPAAPAAPVPGVMAIPADAKAYGQKYTNTKARDVQYQDEFTKGSKHVAETLIELAKRGKSTAASKHLFKTQFCWSAEDVERYFAVSTDLSTGKESIEVTSPVQRLDDKEREKYELKVKAGKFFQGDMTEPYDTSGARSKFMGAGFAIFVMAPDGRIYAGQHKVGLFHHSSFLSGGDVAGAGEIKVDKGRLTYLTNKSGHYLPEKEQVMQVLEELRSRGVSLAGVDYTHLDARNWAATNKFPGGAEGFLRVGRAHMAVPA